jgi:hypothetical protein
MRVEGEGLAKPFHVDEEDEAKLRELHERLLLPAEELREGRLRLIQARLDGVPVEELAEPLVLVQRLVAQVAPLVHDIVRRSPPHELVLKRVISNNRREELHASKAAFAALIDRIAPSRRPLFASLGLGSSSELPESDDVLGALEPASGPISTTPGLRGPGLTNHLDGAEPPIEVLRLPSLRRAVSTVEHTLVSAGNPPPEETPTSLRRGQGKQGDGT